MAVPKKRHNHSRTGKNRSHHALKQVEARVRGVSHRLKKFLSRTNS
ncbi:MAG: hypothetical protein RLZZ223_536 [Candidatus Parcubacteria bacterium]|jgi:ribosomal protein L32